MWAGDPKHLNRPLDMMASLEHKTSHSSIEWEVKMTETFPSAIFFWICDHTSLLVKASIPL